MFSIFVTDGKKSYELSSQKKVEWCFWLKNQDGEGMGESEKNIFDMLDKHFKENF